MLVCSQRLHLIKVWLHAQCSRGRVHAGYIIGACIGAFAVLGVIAAVSVMVIYMRRKVRARAAAQAAAQAALPGPSVYAPVIPQPWTPGQGMSNPFNSTGLTPSYSTEPMLFGRASSGLTPMHSAEPMLHGRSTSAGMARMHSMEAALMTRASSNSSGLSSCRSTELMLPGRPRPGQALGSAVERGQLRTARQYAPPHPLFGLDDFSLRDFYNRA